MAFDLVLDLPDELLPMINAYEGEGGSASDLINLLLTEYFTRESHGEDREKCLDSD
ncbi:hypothetical protein [Methanocalculus taiwanensis]|uniref:hypothetical protein n=1 Tax=Methanocalculus taiwanensis TaxID=106207 RepID=UPI00210116CD|nr:hypothetical protein [Methanocalculus taiwanensis]